ncbi:MAG: hypothetical protein ABL855_00855 [Sideroxydans sp.]
MTLPPYFAATCSLLLFTACDSKTEPTPAPKIFQEERQILDQAKAAAAEQEKQAEEQRKAIEKLTQ